MSRPSPVLGAPELAPELSSELIHDDAWALSSDRRHELARQMQAQQDHWLPRLRNLVEPPAPGPDFPAFLLATRPFAGLRAAIGGAQDLHELDVGTADQLQRFVDVYRDYLTR